MSNFSKLKKRIYEANMFLSISNLVIHTWGNVSELSSDGKYFGIKPSGVEYDILKKEDIVILDLQGNIIEGDLNPSSDTPTHLYIYQNIKGVKGITHTHSTNAVALAAIGKNLPTFSTTHADSFYGDIQCTKNLSKKMIDNEYEKNTGITIFKHFEKNKIDFKSSPGILVKFHGPFTWSFVSAKESVKTAITLEEICKIGQKILAMNPNQSEIDKYIQNKHYNRKHGKNSYYGQKN